MYNVSQALLAIAGRADTCYYVVHALYLETVGGRQCRNIVRVNTECTAADTTGGMDMIVVVMRMPATTRKAVLALAATILETMQQRMLFKKRKRAENRTTVYRSKMQIYLLERKGTLQLKHVF